jgi:hypothetical protein
MSRIHKFKTGFILIIALSMSILELNFGVDIKNMRKTCKKEWYGSSFIHLSCIIEHRAETNKPEVHEEPERCMFWWWQDGIRHSKAKKYHSCRKEQLQFHVARVCKSRIHLSACFGVGKMESDTHKKKNIVVEKNSYSFTWLGCASPDSNCLDALPLAIWNQTLTSCGLCTCLRVEHGQLFLLQ